jgi:hypothetical protein
MDIPVFNLKTLKQYFYYFLAVCVLLSIVIVVLTISTRDSQTRRILTRATSWYYIIPIFILTYLVDRQSKRELVRIIEMDDYAKKFKKYEIQYKNKLIWNAVSVGFTGFLLIISQTNIFLYILIFQLVLIPVFYPKKSIITKDLKNDEIIFI